MMRHHHGHTLPSGDRNKHRQSRLPDDAVPVGASPQMEAR